MAPRAALLALQCALCVVASALPDGRPSLAPIDSYLATTDLLWGWDAEGVTLPNGSLVLDPLAPINWYQAAYIGNGLVGVLVTATQAGPATPALRLDVSRTDIWGPCQNRLPTGYFTLAPLPSLSLVRVDARLDVGAATLRANLTLSSGAIAALSLLVSAADPLGPTGVVLGHLSVISPGGGKAGAPPPLSLTFTPDTEGPCSNATVVSGSVPGPWGTPTEYATQSSPSGTFTLGAAGSAVTSPRCSLQYPPGPSRDLFHAHSLLAHPPLQPIRHSPISAGPRSSRRSQTRSARRTRRLLWATPSNLCRRAWRLALRPSLPRTPPGGRASGATRASSRSARRARGRRRSRLLRTSPATATPLLRASRCPT